MRVVSREYKVMLDPEAFADRRPALRALRDELAALADAAGDATLAGEFDEPRERTIAFLDTPGRDLRRDGFVLRRRLAGDKAQFTLKCRSEDRYFAAGADLDTVDGFEADDKLEEDIAPPFRCRFSHSNTVKPPKGSRLRRGEPPTTLAGASAIFPGLKGVRRDGRKLPGDTPMEVVNGLVAFERVFTGPTLAFRGRKGVEGEASAALIIWTDGEAGRPLVAEFSFRLEDPKERFSREVSRSARSYFEAVQRLGRARPDGTTKTAFVYGDGGED